MKPTEVRQRILDEHERLRDSIYIVRNLAREAARGDSSRVPMLQKRAVGLDAELRTHLDLEDRHLVPVVLECLGEQAAAELSREHAEQRALLECVLRRLRDDRRPPLLLARELQTLSELLLEDMAREEEELLANANLWDDLSDDVASVSETLLEWP
jgi:hemerythrin-like domain-containing protein